MWSVNLQKDLDVRKPGYSFAGSPLVEDIPFNPFTIMSCCRFSYYWKVFLYSVALET